MKRLPREAATFELSHRIAFHLTPHLAPHRIQISKTCCIKEHSNKCPPYISSFCVLNPLPSIENACQKRLPKWKRSDRFFKSHYTQYCCHYTQSRCACIKASCAVSRLRIWRKLHISLQKDHSVFQKDQHVFHSYSYLLANHTVLILAGVAHELLRNEVADSYKQTMHNKHQIWEHSQLLMSEQDSWDFQ